MKTTVCVPPLALAALLATVGCGDLDDDAVEATSPLGALISSPPRGFVMSDGTPAIVAKSFSGGILFYYGSFGSAPDGPITFGVHLEQTAAPWAYTRHDGLRSFVYIDPNGHVHQILYPNATTFIDTDLTTSGAINAPVAKVGASVKSPTPDVIGYVRTKRSQLHSAIVYVSANNHVIELLSNPAVSYPTINASFFWSDLTNDSYATVTVARGSAFPLVRADGINTVYYIASDNHIHELANLGVADWYDNDLYPVTGETVLPKSDAMAYTRSDGYDTVVFEGADSMIHELAYRSDRGWGHGTLPSVGALNGMRGRPFGYVRADSMNTIVYVSNKNSVHEIALWPTGWADAALPIGANETPQGQVFGLRSDSASSVLFQVNVADINPVVEGRELRLRPSIPWTEFSLP
jgi:hypothetical protein